MDIGVLHLVEGGSSADFRTVKSHALRAPDLMHRILEIHASSIAAAI